MRTLSVAALLLVMSFGSSLLAQSPPVVGAIRWDAWSGGSVTAEVERTLSPAKYHDRLPWFAEVIGEDKVRIRGDRAEIMDREIQFAAGAGLDYWAFLLYPESSPMSNAIQQYLKSDKRRQLNFCLILHNAFSVGDDRWPAERDRAVALLKEPGYQTVLRGRPLVYAFQISPRGATLAARVKEFRQAARQAGLDPYMVYMGWNPAADFERSSREGFDAVSAYAHGGAQRTFEELSRSLESGPWQTAVKARTPYIPLVTTGWDKRPRKDHPVSWEKGHAYHRQETFPSTATPREIADHLSRALAFVRGQADLCPANAVIIYAWNEHDEGGWLSPTWTAAGQPNTQRLDAIRSILRPANKAAGK